MYVTQYILLPFHYRLCIGIIAPKHITLIYPPLVGFPPAEVFH